MRTPFAVRERREPLPIDLDTAPEVDALLVELGLGPLLRDSVTSPVGRNDAWLGDTTEGRAVFVKRLTGATKDVADRLRRLLAFESHAESAALSLSRPRLIGSDDTANLVVFERITDSRTGAELMVDQTFAAEQARCVGRSIGELHRSSPSQDAVLDDTPPPFPPVGFLRGLPLALLNRCSAGELEAWRLLQGDETLIAALWRLRELERESPRVPSHCDLRVDQLLVRSHEVFLTDWEEFRLADPARDVGAFAGEWIYRSVLDVVTDRGDADFVDVEFTHELILQRGVEKMNRLLPFVAQFWRGYREICTTVDDGLAVRATAFAGWHLLDRLVAGATSASRLTGIQRAAAGVGRAAVVSPERFAGTLGFGVAA